MNTNKTTTRTIPQDETWTVEQNADGCTLMVKRGPDARAVCNIWDDDQGRADAALICAAPAMLRALSGLEVMLRKALPFIQCADDQDLSVSIQAGEWIGEIQDLISKAKGEQP